MVQVLLSFSKLPKGAASLVSINTDNVAGIGQITKIYRKKPFLGPYLCALALNKGHSMRNRLLLFPDQVFLYASMSNHPRDHLCCVAMELNKAPQLPDVVWGQVFAYLMMFDEVFNLKAVSKLFCSICRSANAFATMKLLTGPHNRRFLVRKQDTFGAVIKQF